MDLSKLPKLSETPESKQSPANSTPDDRIAGTAAGMPGQRDIAGGRRLEYATPVPELASGDAYFALVIGVFLLLMAPRFWQWSSHKLFGTHFDPFIDSLSGAVVPYTQVPAFWSDLGPALFAAALIVEAIVVLKFYRRPALWVVFVLTAIATAYNVGYTVISYPKYGLAPISFLAGAYGIYATIMLWKRIRPG